MRGSRRIAAGCSKTPAPAPDTRTADMQAVKEVEAAWLKDIAAKDVDKWCQLFCRGRLRAIPRGRDTVWKGGHQSGDGAVFRRSQFFMNFQSTRTMASKGGDMVYSQGTYTMTMTNPKTKKPMTDKGKYLTVYTKQADGSWKAVADTYNSDSSM